NGQAFSIDRYGILRAPEDAKITDKIPDIVNEINAKYDAELAALEQAQPTVSQQPNIIVKPGVSELFESNPELANEVYEVLGFGQESNLPTSDETINIYAGSNQNAELSNFAIRPFTINVETPS